MTSENESRDASNSATGRDPFMILLVCGLVLVVAGFVWVLSRVEPRISPDLGDGGTLLADPIPLPAFELTDHLGQPFRRESLEGRWSLLFFGYSACPDVCPFVLGQLARVSRDWETHADGDPMPQVIFVSVDPERDDPARLAEYVPFFDEDFRGISGPASELDPLARTLGVFYRVRPGETNEGEGYLVDHAAKIWLIDPEARFAAVLDDPHEPEPFIDLVEKVRAYFLHADPPAVGENRRGARTIDSASLDDSGQENT